MIVAYRCVVRAYSPRREKYGAFWRCGKPWSGGVTEHSFTVIPATAERTPEYRVALEEGAIEEWQYKMLLNETMLDIVSTSRERVELHPVVIKPPESIFEETAN